MKTGLQRFPKIPRIYSLRNAFRLVHNPIPVIQETMQRFGDTYSFHIGGKSPAHASRDPEVIKHVLRVNHKNYNKSPFQSKDLAFYIGRGLLTNNGEDWLRQRRLIQPVFHRDKINALVDLMEDECDQRLGTLIRSTAQKIDTHAMTMDITFHIAARTIFSNDLSYEELVKLRDEIERVQKMVVFQVRQPYKKWYYQLSGKIKRHKALADNAKKLVAEKAINRLKSGKKENDLLQHMLELKYADTGESMTIDRLADELIILLVASHETTAHAISWALSLLARNQEWQQRIAEEIVGGVSDPVQAMRSNSVIYAIINETMRMYPPAWVVDRMSIEADEIQGRYIPKASFMMCFIYGLHHHADYWIKPNEFNPERFMGTEINSDYFIPFGAGPRLCIGNHFAMLEQYVILKNIFSRYNLPYTNIPMPEIKPLITLQPKKADVLQFNFN